MQIILLFLMILLVFALLRSWVTSRAMGGIPGSMGWPIIGESLSFISEFSSPHGIYNFMKKRQLRYGKVFKSSILGRSTVFMTGTEASKILLSGKDGMVSLNLFYAGKQLMGPTSLLQTTGEAHKQLRRLIAEPLSIDSMKKYLQFINNLAIDTLDQWTGRKAIYVHDEVSTFTLKVISNILMSLEPCGEEQEQFRANFKLISAAFASLPLCIPGTCFYRGIKARDRIYSLLDGIITQRKEGSNIQLDFLQSLIKKHSKETATENGEDKLTDTQLKDNILTLLIAGHDTTTAALTWLIKFLEENPTILGKLREEHIKIQEGRNGSSTLSWPEVSKMTYTSKVINETLRKATILPWYSRKAAQDFEINGYKIKKGWSLNLDVVSIHHDQKLFPDSQKFDPSRFDEPLPPYNFLGFGSGQRMCPGNNLAKLEISVFIHHLVCKYRWRHLERDDSVQATLVRMPKNKYPIIVEKL
ncbi:hypothetical protein Scep_018776 [Stephania cephalantha]|uniref:Cytochrome P450 n=1 Tax=Stephania cephalantha TaxID=152367 RepID=A0AAP0I9S2_9MAGN